MDYKQYKSLVDQITIGKKLPDAIYLHESALNSALPPGLLSFTHNFIETIEIPKKEWNIVKFYRRDFKLSLLLYPEFSSDSYPALLKSYTVNLKNSTFRISDYGKSDNPPILHRKETFIVPKHPSFPLFAEITKEGEAAGLYSNPKLIGFRSSWYRLIHKKGYALVKGRLVRKSSITINANNTNFKLDEPVKRHLTAIDRNALSAPMKTLARHNYLNGDHTIFDYGCGKGDDVRELEVHGLDIAAWDPVYVPDGKKRKSHIVNLGFVINVIETRKERDSTLKDAFKFANKFLVVSAMIAGEATTNKFIPYLDGSLTTRGTFQKYYSQLELKAYIEDIIGVNAIPVSPGIFYVFKDKKEEEFFLSERQKTHHTWAHLSERTRKVRGRSAKDIIEKNKQLFNDFWQTCLELGRLPATSEFEFSSQIRKVAGSLPKAFNYINEYYDTSDFISAEASRRNDLLVYFALGLFEQRKALIHLPDSLKRDIKAFFKSHPEVQNEAKQLLFSISEPSNIENACATAYATLGCGHLNEGHSLIIHRSYLGELPPILRVYVGAATKLYGDIDNIDLIKIHMTSGKVSLMIYDDFDNKPLPPLKERIKINLRKQYIDFFEYGGEFPYQPLYLKSIYIKPEYLNYKKQVSFDNSLNKINLFDLDSYGPSMEEFTKLLAEKNLEIKDFKLSESSPISFQEHQ